MVGEATTGRRQAHSTTKRLEQHRAELRGEQCELLRHRRGRHAEFVGDRRHRTESRELDEQAKAAWIHRSIVHAFLNDLSTEFTWT